MAKLPTYRELGGVPSGRSGRVIASYDTSAVGRGMIDYGTGMARAGDALASVGKTIGGVTADLASSLGEASKPTQQQKFETQRRFFEFSSQQQQLLEQAQQSVEPGAVGFREQVQQQYQQNAKQFFSSIPDALKPEYDSKLFVVEDKLGNLAGTFESAERQRYYTSEVNQGLDTLSNNLYANPDNFDQNYKEGEEFIESIPDESLSKVEKDQLKQQWRTKAQLAALSGVSPEERIRLLGGTDPQAATGPAPTTARLSHATYGRAQQVSGYLGERHGLSPIAAAAVAGHAVQESGARPSGAVGDKGTAFGIFQWRGDRLTNLKSFAEQRGSDWKDLGTQLDFAAWEGQNGDPGARRAWAELQSATTLEEAVAAWMHFERPKGYTTSNPAGGHGYASRLAAARRILGGEGGDEAPPIGANPSFDPGRADPRFADIPYETANKIIDSALSEIKTQRREFAIALETAVQNAPTAILNTGEYDGPLPSLDEFVNAYGPEEGAERFTKFSTAVDVSRQAFDFRTMTVEEIEDAVASAVPKSSGDAAVLETSRYETLAKAAQATIKARNADPAAYVQQTFPSVSRAWEEAQSSGDYRTALTATASAQEQLGIRNMRLLPKEVAAGAITSFKDETKSGEDRVGAVTGLIFSTNDPEQRQAIFEQLVAEGLPDATEGAIEAYARGDEGAGRRLMEAAIIDPSKLPGTTNVKPADIDAEIQAQIMDDGQVGDIFYGLSDGTIENQERAIRDSKLLTNAVNLRVRNGETLDAAIEGAARDLYGDVKPVSGNFDVNAQILVPSDADETVILDGLAGQLPTVRSLLESSMVVPPDVPTQGGEKAVADAVRANYIDNVMVEGYFRNSGNGYAFIDPYVGAAISGPDGEPIIFSEEEILSAPPRTQPDVSPSEEAGAGVVAPRPQEEIDRETYGEFAPLLNNPSPDMEQSSEAPPMTSGGGGF